MIILYFDSLTNCLTVGQSEVTVAEFEPKSEHRSNFPDLEADKPAKAEETFNAERSNINIFQPLSKIRQGMGVGCQNLIPRYPVHYQPLGHWTVLMSL